MQERTHWHLVLKATGMCLGGHLVHFCTALFLRVKANRYSTALAGISCAYGFLLLFGKQSHR
jgi:hypothetical protein